MNDELVHHIHTQTIPAAYSLLPAKMSSREATAQILAIGFQESEFNARIQRGRGTTMGTGPAHGFFQFEKNGGVKEILTSQQTKDFIVPICKMFLIAPTPDAVWNAIVYNDVLAVCFARLLLWKDPRSMPTPIEWKKGWDIYVKNWRPGKPHPEPWKGRFEAAWNIVQGK